MTSNPDTLADLAWLRGLKETGHVGEGLADIQWRQDRNDRIDRIATALERAVEPVAWLYVWEADNISGEVLTRTPPSPRIENIRSARPLYALPLPVETRSQEGERERIARIVDPRAWPAWGSETGDYPARRETAYAKADAILARPVGGG